MSEQTIQLANDLFDVQVEDLDGSAMDEVGNEGRPYPHTAATIAGAGARRYTYSPSAQFCSRCGICSTRPYLL